METKAKSIKYVAFDVDGVLTNGSITYTSDGGEIKSFNAKDGFGINLLRKAGLKIGIITARVSPIVERRAKELKFDDVFTGQRNKKEAIETIKEKYQLKDKNIAYMGDDILDLPVLLSIGFSACPKDAVSEVLTRVDFVANANGGSGAVRHFADFILKSQKKYTPLIEEYISRK